MISLSVLIPAIVTADDSSLLEDPRKALRLSSRLLVLVRYVIEWDNGQLQGFLIKKVLWVILFTVKYGTSVFRQIQGLGKGLGLKEAQGFLFGNPGKYFLKI